MLTGSDVETLLLFCRLFNVTAMAHPINITNAAMAIAVTSAFFSGSLLCFFVRSILRFRFLWLSPVSPACIVWKIHLYFLSTLRAKTGTFRNGTITTWTFHTLPPLSLYITLHHLSNGYSLYYILISWTIIICLRSSSDLVHFSAYIL